MREIKLVLTDLDGTALPRGGSEASPAVSQAIAEVQQHGVIVAAATGRSYRTAKDGIWSLGIGAPSVFENGATVRDARDGKVLHKKWLAADRIREITKAVYQSCVKIDHTGEYQLHVPSVDEVSHVSDVDSPYVFGLIKAEDEQKVLSQLADIRQISYFFHPAIEAEDHLSFQVTAAGADKRYGVERLLEQFVHLQIRKENILAIGDEANDPPLLEIAGTKVAMGNACDELKLLADFVVADVEHDGLAEALRIARTDRVLVG